MTIRARKRIFYALFILFFVIGGIVILYAEGWRIDFETFHAEKVGAILVRSFPENAEITLDGKPIPNQSNFLNSATFINDLFPKNYRLTLDAPGYAPWNENVSVAPSLVAELKDAVLVPQVPVVMNEAGATSSASTTASTTAEYVFYDFTKNATTTLSAVASSTGFSARTLLPTSTTIAELKWIRNGTAGILATNGSLYEYSVGDSAVQKLADDVKDFYPTPSGDGLAALENQSLEIFFFGTIANNYYRFNLPSMGSVVSLAWYGDENHLFVAYPDHVSFLDLADTSLQNYISVANGTSPSYDPSKNALSITDPNGALERFDFPR